MSSRIRTGLVRRKEGGWHILELAPFAWQVATERLVMLGPAKSGSKRCLLRRSNDRGGCSAVVSISFRGQQPCFCVTVMAQGQRGSLEGGSPPVALMEAPWRQRSEAPPFLDERHLVMSQIQCQVF